MHILALLYSVSVGIVGHCAIACRRNMDRRKVLGTVGERLVQHLLHKKRQKIIGINYTSTYGEVDIISTVGETVVFIEVKSWYACSISDLQYAINRVKRRHIIATAYDFLVRHTEYARYGLRFDVVFVNVNDWSYRWIENAFGIEE